MKISLNIFLIGLTAGTLTKKDRQFPTPEEEDNLEIQKEWEERKKFLSEKWRNEERHEVAYEKLYVPNPRHLFDPRYHTDEKIARNNIKWLEEIHYNPGQSKFITKMINMPETVPFVPKFAAEQIDPTPYCWVLMVYNSDDRKGREETMELLRALSKYYYERCGVSSVDLGYPTNAAIFASLKDESFPLLVVKKPLRANKMFVPESLKIRPTDRAEGHFKMTPIDTWAEVISNQDLVENPLENFRKITEIYEESTPNVKIAALLMEHYHEVNKTVLEGLLGDMLDNVRLYAEDKLIEEGYHMAAEREDRHKLTPAEIEKHDLNYAKKFAEEMENIYKDEKTISFGYLLLESLKLAHYKNPNIQARFSLAPDPHPDISKTFHNWIHSEL